MEELQEQIRRLTSQVEEMGRKIFDLNNPSFIPDKFMDLLVKNGFLRWEKELEFTSGANIQNFYEFVRFGDKQRIISAFPSEYIKEFDVTIVGDWLNTPLHGLVDGTQIMLITTGTLPAPLVETFPYYVVSASTDRFKVSTSSGGSPEDITTVGLGSHYWIYFT